MAAVTSVRNGAASGTRTSKGLFLVVTLLSLVCYTSSLLDKGSLREMKENLQRTKEKLEILKERVKRDTFSGLMNDYMHILDPMIALMKTYAGESPDLLDPMVPLLKKTKEVLEKTKTFIDDEKKGWDVEIEKLEDKIKQSEKIFDFLDEQQAEL